MFENFFDNLSIWVEAFVNLVVDIFNRMISFAVDVVEWFRVKINGVRHKIAYMITVSKLKKALQEAGLGGVLDSKGGIPTFDCGIYGEQGNLKEGLSLIVKDEDNDKITDFRILGNTQGGVDDKLRNVMRDNDIVRLA